MAGVYLLFSFYCEIRNKVEKKAVKVDTQLEC